MDSKAVENKESAELGRLHDRLETYIQRIENTKCRIRVKVGSISSFPESKLDPINSDKIKTPESFVESMNLSLDRMLTVSDELEYIDDHLTKLV